MLDAITCLARMVAAGPVTERERRLAAAVQLAAERARRAVSWLAM